MFQITSNLLYLCASVVAAVENHLQWAVIMLGVTTCSVLYHTGELSREADVCMAIVAFVYGCQMYLRRKILSWPVPFLTLCMIACLVIPKPDQEAYDRIHPWAHIFGGFASISLAAS